MRYFTTFKSAVRWIEGIVPYGIKPGLVRMNKLLEVLDSPEKGLKFIHVGGTNGKGSTCAFISEILYRSNYSVGLFTSPCIESFTNRIKINGVDIPENDVIEICNRLKPVVDRIGKTSLGTPTMFEVTTCMAFIYFSKKKPDFVVLEVGLGGRLDSTNVITPLVSVITNIGFDHMDRLGNTIEEIAEEKSGIIKPNIPLVSAVENNDALNIIKKNCNLKSCDLYLINRDFLVEKKGSVINEQKFNFKSELVKYDDLTITLNGNHQYKNASVAIMTLEILKVKHNINLIGLKQGLKNTKWAGRLELISKNPRILLDGAHNPDGAKTLAETLSNTFAHSYSKLHLMIGMLNTKAHYDYLLHILPLVDSVVITEPNFQNKMESEILYEVAHKIKQEKELKLDILVHSNWMEGLQTLISKTNEQDLALVSGTLYLISDVRSWLLHRKISYKGW